MADFFTDYANTVFEAPLTGKNIYEVGVVKKPMVMDPLYIEGEVPKMSGFAKLGIALAVAGIAYVGLKGAGVLK